MWKYESVHLSNIFNLIFPSGKCCHEMRGFSSNSLVLCPVSVWKRGERRHSSAPELRMCLLFQMKGTWQQPRPATALRSLRMMKKMDMMSPSHLSPLPLLVAHCLISPMPLLPSAECPWKTTLSQVRELLCLLGAAGWLCVFETCVTRWTFWM